MRLKGSSESVAKGLGFFWLGGHTFAGGEKEYGQLSVIWRKLKRLVACLPLNKTLQSIVQGRERE